MGTRALIVGAGGQLGEAMAARLVPRYDIVARDRRQLDVTSSRAVSETVRAVAPAVIINCAAYTNVDGAEAAPAEALAVNAWAVRLLAHAALETGATLVHYSTDFVFDGDADRPYEEQDAPNPRSAYAISKLLGEWFAAQTPRHYILRVESLFGGAHGTSSIDRMFDRLRAGAEVRAFADRSVSPSYVEDVIAATDALVSGSGAFGLYHCVNTGWTTWAALARELARLAGIEHAPIVDVQVADVPLVAPRPRFAALSNRKLAEAGIAMPTWEDALGRYVGKK